MWGQLLPPPQENSLFVFVEQASCLFSIAMPDIQIIGNPNFRACS